MSMHFLLTRASTAVLVLGLHVLLGWITVQLAAHGRRIAEPPSLVLVPLESSARPAPVALASSTPRILSPEPVAQLVRVADVPPSAPAAAAHIDSDAADVGQLLRICGGARQRRSRASVESMNVVLLVRVEADGRVSDVRPEAGAEAESIEPAADHCLRTRALFTPNLIEGAPVASWRVLRWPAETVGRDR